MSVATESQYFGNNFFVFVFVFVRAKRALCRRHTFHLTRLFSSFRFFL